jgi:hypothetical protein
VHQMTTMPNDGPEQARDSASSLHLETVSPAPLRPTVSGISVTSKSELRVLLLACLAGAVIFTIGFQATKSPSLRAGTTVRDPQEYFERQLRRQHLPFQHSSVTRTSGGWYTIGTRFVVFGREITSTVSNYHFDN